jgi:hypothetical protein
MCRLAQRYTAAYKAFQAAGDNTVTIKADGRNVKKDIVVKGNQGACALSGNCKDEHGIEGLPATLGMERKKCFFCRSTAGVLIIISKHILIAIREP